MSVAATKLAIRTVGGSFGFQASCSGASVQHFPITNVLRVSVRTLLSRTVLASLAVLFVCFFNSLRFRSREGSQKMWKGEIREKRQSLKARETGDPLSHLFLSFYKKIMPLTSFFFLP